MKGIVTVLVVVTAMATAAAVTQAQSPAAEVVTAGGLHTARFQTPQGRIVVAVPSDAAPGDTIAGLIAAEPAGASPAQQAENLRVLNGLVMQLPNQKVPVSARRYTWAVPGDLRTGRAALTLVAADGRAVSQATVPLDAVPAPVQPRAQGRDAFDLPTNVQAEQSAVIRGPSNGTFTGRSVRVGDRDADVLAVSPRRSESPEVKPANCRCG
jgi:hypothetical protein